MHQGVTVQGTDSHMCKSKTRWSKLEIPKGTGLTREEKKLRSVVTHTIPFPCLEGCSPWSPKMCPGCHLGQGRTKSWHKVGEQIGFHWCHTHLQIPVWDLSVMPQKSQYLFPRINPEFLPLATLPTSFLNFIFVYVYVWDVCSCSYVCMHVSVWIQMRACVEEKGQCRVSSWVIRHLWFVLFCFLFFEPVLKLTL